MTTLNKLVRVIACTAAAAAVTALGLPAQAQESFKGKQIILYVGYAPGGGYDTYARAFSRHLPNHLIGKPDVVVKNMPGAGSVKLANYLFNSARHDGTEIGALGREIPTSTLLGVKNTRYKVTDFTWLGSLGQEGTWCVAWHAAPFTKAQDLMDKQFIIGGTNGRSLTIVLPIVLNNLFGTKLKVITGYPGGAALHLAMERGEIQGRCAATLSSIGASRPDWIRDKKIRFLLDVSLSDKRNMPDVPLISEFAKTDEDREKLELLLAPDSWTRPYVAPPRLQEGRADQLRKAFVDVYSDDNFKRDMERHKLVLAPMSGAAMSARIARLNKIAPEVIKAAMEASTRTDRTEMAKAVVPIEKALGTITNIERGGRRVFFKGRKKKGRLDVSSSGTKVTIAGKKTKRGSLKAGMRCAFSYQGRAAKTITCN